MKLKGLFFLASILISISITGCKGSTGAAGSAGPAGKAGLSTGTIAGVVVDSSSSKAVSNATVALIPAVLPTTTTDSQGKFSFPNIPVGPYQVVVSAKGYAQYTSGYFAVAAGSTVTVSVSLALAPLSLQPSLITWPSNYYMDAYDVGLYNVGYNAAVNISANVTDQNYPASALSYTWTVIPYPQYGGVETQIPGATTASITFTTDPMMSQVNGITPDQGRDSIISIGPTQVGLYRLTLYVTNPAGVQAVSEIMVRAASKTAGIENVGIGTPVYLSFTSTTPSISIISKPAGSNAVVTNVAASPYTVVTFTPDVAGLYTIKETTTGIYFTIAAGTWMGAIDGSGGYSNSSCSACHNGTITGNFAPWFQTQHASMFTRGIEGLIGDGTVGPSGYEPADIPPYDSSPIPLTTNEVCLSCHTVGYDQAPLANNDGFDDVMKTLGWAFPDTLQLSNWTNMLSNYAGLAALSNIQCENCHGPSNSQAHHSTNQAYDLQARVGWDAGVCSQCHDSNGPDWAISPHANLDLSLSEATIQGMGSNAAHCGRCHSAQGFNAYIDQVSSGVNNGMQNLVGLNLTQLAALGLTVSQVQPQTCQACHDPHNAANPDQLRVYGNTFTLAAGFTADSVGAGAICMECHNTRNGLRNDSVPVADYSAPHTPSQADILMGQSSYFTGITGTTTIYVSKHANIADTCVTCHMVYNPNNPGGAPSSHVWTINPQDQGTICQNCHGSGVTGYGLQTEVQGLLNQLETNLSNTVIAAINFSASSGYTIWASNTKTIATPVTAAAFSEVHGQQGYQLWDSSNATFTLAMGSITATTGSAPGPVFWINSAANPLTTTVLEAGWNYALVNSDGSLGIHNPTYILTILNDTLQKLP
ncbi:MAG: carboxypeptidase regulatory-like domain-containing protein [Deltaproteobacteria bacterium]|nr:carboxypeptidase regulatory-like domain-containing protein [Deltaproteobacteria bacterium]MCL5792851.1 carboxypeptidase regulatory-like domain-containing protein [Deltaproteobacteria bacterium]